MGFEFWQIFQITNLSISPMKLGNWLPNKEETEDNGATLEEGRRKKE